jgi:single-stranded DNA-binding protein
MGILGLTHDENGSALEKLPVTIKVAIGFVGADPEQRQARNNGSRFTVLSVATQRSWKNAEDEWVSKVEWHRVAIIWN